MTIKEQSTPVVAFKGFDQNLVCNPDGVPFQYAIGETYEHQGSVTRCGAGGFHSCEYPLDVFSYYNPATSRFAIVEAGGEVDREAGGDTKIASAKITIQAEIKIPQLVKYAIDWITARLDKSLEQTNTGSRSAASNTGYGSAASNTGYGSAASNTGYGSAASNTGDYSAASVEGKDSVAMASGYAGHAKACEGSAIVLCFRDDENKLIAIRAAIAGQAGVKADTWYSLDASGEFVEVDAPTDE